MQQRLEMAVFRKAPSKRMAELTLTSRRRKKIRDMLKNAAALIPTWFRSWGLRSLPPVEIAVNNRLRRTRGRAVLSESRIEIRPSQPPRKG